MNHQTFIRIFLMINFVSIVLTCKPSINKQLDRLLEEGSVIQTATFCAKHSLQLQERKEDCDRVTKVARSEIDTILNRRLDMGIAPVIVPKSQGEEIEEFLKVHTQMGIRYWEIWKSNVILE